MRKRVAEADRQSRCAFKMTHRERRSYDHRVKAQIIATGNVNLFPGLDIPRSTASSWIRRGRSEVVSLDEGLDAESKLWNRFARLERRVSMLTAVLRLVSALLHVSGFKRDFIRIPDANGKRRLLYAIERARLTMPLAAARCAMDGAMAGSSRAPSLDPNPPHHNPQ
jgi:hypothetical protein